MSTELVPIPAAAEPPATIVKCASVDCSATFIKGLSFVPDLITLYEQERETGVDKKYPLTRGEVESHEFCATCAQDFKKHDIKTFRTSDTLRLMAGWAEANVRRISDELVRKGQAEARQAAWHERQLLRVANKPDRGFVNETFAKAKPVVERPGKKHRTHHRVPKPPKSAIKHYGDDTVFKVKTPEAEPKKNKKKAKGGDQSKGGKGKG